MKLTSSNSTTILLVLALLGFVGYKIYQMPKFSDGEVVPGFQAELIDGSSFALSDLKESYVLLDFWGSWCGPCRQESPDLVSLHKAFNGKSFSDAKGFEIVSVAIETNEKRWKKAIQSDNLNWPHHIVQLDRFKGQIATQYGVREIPTKYLLDTKGEVVMVNPSFEELRAFLASKRAN
ncbi:MAG: TlpA disulfide reductase family protein [Saprospiraceae bacterium]|nr:TlpA disulfide reductase family protein [Saprospiraceae bacterium]